MARYEFVEGSSSKFWEITLEGSSFTTTYGKIGTAGQSTTKPWKDEATAQKEHDKLVAEKTKKGYVLAGGAAPAPAPAPAAKPAKKAPAPAADVEEEEPAPKPAPRKGKAAAPAPAPAPAAPAAAGGAQRFELVEGSSSKFWEIKLEGTSFTTTYGKIGTAGTSGTKSFADAAAAKKEHDKLVAEKTKKGYSPADGGGGGGGGAPAGGGGGAHAKAGTAFRLADLEQLDGTPGEKAETFMGQKVMDFDEEEGVKDGARRAYRIEDEEGFDSDGEGWKAKFSAFLEQPGAAKVKAFVVGLWGNAMDAGDAGATSLFETIAAASPKLPDLAALFVCDVISEESEISWQHTSDVAPLLKAYPNLQHLRVRGNPGGGKLTHLQHDRLRSLQVEGSNITQDVFEQVGEADLPALEHLELWLGPDDYAGNKDVACLTPILSGKLFPALRYLGLRDSDIADDVAAAVAQSPIVSRLETLDLSLGNLRDKGVLALLASPSVAKLKRLDIRHHYASAENVKKLRAHLAGGTLVESAAEVDDPEEEERYVAVTE